MKMLQRVKRSLKSILSIGAAILCSLSAWADDTWTDGSGNVWTYLGSQVTGVSFETTSLVIPETLGGNPVTSFTSQTFAGKERLVRVTIPATVTSIPDGAFAGCSNLREVIFSEANISAEVSYIGYRAFANCSNLLSFSIPNSVTTLGRGVFSGCTLLESVTIGDGVTKLTGVPYQGNTGGGSSTHYADYGASSGSSSLDLKNQYDDGLFYNCTSLKKINWGASVQEIGNVAFLNCSELESIEIPDTVTSLGHHVFVGCSKLASVKIGAKVPSIGLRTFFKLPNLTSVTFGAGLNEIQTQAFEGCVNLQNFTLPTKIQYIRYRAFAGCNKALTEVTIPTNSDELETVLGQGVFSECTSLATVTFGGSVRTLTGVPYQGNTGGGSSTHYADYGEGKGSSSLDLKNQYDDGLFYNCTSLKKINWGSGIQTIGNVAFLNCTSLTDVVLPQTVDGIGNHAFCGCTSLKTVTVLGRINSIGIRAFCNCPALHYVDFRGPVMDFDPGDDVFAFCNDRVTVYAAEGSTGWTGVAEVPGLPTNGTWGGARITYAPPPKGAGNPYDFYPYILTDRVNRTDYEWSAPILLTTNSYVRGSTIPTTCTTIREGSPIYLSYAFNEYWRGEAFTVTNRFTLSGAKSGTFDYSGTWEAHADDLCLLYSNATPALLQNLAPGNYTLTLTVNGDNRLAETDDSNNGASIVFTIVGSPRYTVTFNLNGASGTAPTSRTIIEGRTIGDLPTVTAPAGWTFLGWFTAATGGTKITSSKVVNSAFTCYAQWEKRDMGFYTPSSEKGWSQPFFVATSGSATAAKTQFKKGERIYVKYAFVNLAGYYDLSGFINRFTLTGAKSATFDAVNSGKLEAGYYQHDGGNWYPTALQNLPAGKYTLTCTLDATGVIAETNEGNNTRSITFEVVGSTPQPELGKGDYSVAGDKLVGTAPESAASVYDGYLYLKNDVVGTIQAKVSKPKLNKKLGISTAKTSVTIQINGEKKISLKSEINLAIGQFIATDKKSERILILNIGLDGVSGTFGKYDIDGARNFFDSKDKAEKSTAEEILKPYLGAYSMICDGGILSVTIAKKGKVTIKGNIDGNKVSAKAQALIGEKMISIPVVYSKKSVNLAFTIWLPINGGNAKIIGLDDAIIGKAGTLKNNAKFMIDGDIGKAIETEDPRTLELLPNNEAITVSGSKWLVTGGIKAAKVAYKKGEFTITEGKKGAGIVNPSGLKLSYKSKDGSFTGSFTAYAIVKGKLKKHKATVEGILIGDVGYGTITIKKVGTWAVTIK